jgi:hypothetical protein
MKTTRQPQSGSKNLSATMSSRTINDDCDEFTSTEQAGNGDAMRDEPECEADQPFRPVNFISDEVHKLIRTWELAQAHMPQQELNQATDSMVTDSLSDYQSGESDMQPMLLMSVSEAPPKRFYRSFWRSRARRILEVEREKVLSSRAAGSNSDASEDGSSATNALH